LICIHGSCGKLRKYMLERSCGGFMDDDYMSRINVIVSLLLVEKRIYKKILKGAIMRILLG
ncbi:unnamed protein product, partial [Sphenostylis stenocarpa]